MPAIGLGTFGSDHVSADEMARAVRGAGSVGYRHFDCAEVYGNEAEIGEALKRLQGSGIARDELWINSKVWNDHHRPADVAAACERSLRNLQLDYLDLYFVHWPFRNHHPPGCSVESRSPDATPYRHEAFMETWAAMESLVQRGLVRNIGTSNMTVPKLQRLLEDASIKPSCNEMELHPHFQQPEFIAFLEAQQILPVGYCPIGSPARPERDRTPDDTVDIEDPVIVSIAQAHGVHPATICIKWAVQRGQVPIPMSTNPRNYLANLKAVVEDPLTDEQMSAIAKIDRDCRLIKGQVFLWESAKDWRDLWDLAGAITQ
ncbi:aldo/keto reductase [Pelagicoccus sp. SDUM812003]|uniref:aldo/keto reductase n=1 Tax=Pelagicoccus sp. SDUM812003 TaxID=3041267 RepID=UPI0031F301D6